MRHRTWLVGALAGLATLGPAFAQDRPLFQPPPSAQPPAPLGMPVVPLTTLPPGVRERVASVLEKPALSARGQPETFNADPATYRWLLDHPDVAVKLWRQLGARVSEIESTAGVYRWHDGQGSEVRWHAVSREPGLLLWYGEGKVKASALLPTTQFRAIALMQYTQGQDANGRPAIRHQVHFMVRCDSRAVALAARLLGGTAPRLAEQYLGQLQMFYGGLSWYLYQDEARARRLYARIGLDVGDERR